MKRNDRLHAAHLVGLAYVNLLGCLATEIKPVDLYPEDQCAQCRMTVSMDAFASEIITKEGDVFKFDDLGCQDRFLTMQEKLHVAAIFVKDFDSHAWITREQSTIVRTNLKTPMSSGKVAFRDSLRARQFVLEHPDSEAIGSDKEQQGQKNAGRN